MLPLKNYKVVEHVQKYVGLEEESSILSPA